MWYKVTKNAFFLALAFTVSDLSGASRAQDAPGAFVPGAPWRGEDGTVCHFSKNSDRFLSCVSMLEYGVRGTTRSELLREMRRMGPANSHGVTTTRVEWGEDKNGRCMIAVLSTIELPLLLDEASTPPELRDYWYSKLTALEAHERRHHDLALRESWAEFLNDCQTVTGLVDRINELNERYDRETRHGELEGAQFE